MYRNNSYGSNPISFEELEIKNKKVNTKEYVKALNVIIAGSIGCKFALVCGLSSFTLSYLKKICKVPLKSFIIQVYGSSCSGKSTFGRLAASVYANPYKESGLFRSWHGTTASILKSLDGNHGIVRVFDESEFCNLDQWKAIYEFIEVENSNQCNTILSIGEGSILSGFSRSEAYLRLLEFLNLSITQNAAHNDKIQQFIANNYGVIASVLCHEMIECNDDKGIEEKYNEFKYDLESKVSEKGGLSNDAIISIYSVLMVSAHLLTEIGISIDIPEIEKLLLQHYKNL